MLHMMVVKHVEDLEPYGFNITVINKASIEIIESIADENFVSVTYARGQWYYIEKGNMNLLNTLLRRYDYYV